LLVRAAAHVGGSAVAALAPSAGTTGARGGRRPNVAPRQMTSPDSSEDVAVVVDPSMLRSVGAGRGDYIQETRFRYVGPGEEPGAAAEEKKSGCSKASCFGLGGRSTCTGKARDLPVMTVSHAGPGAGEYVQETAFKYVGAGVGDFALVSDPPAEPPAEDCVTQVIPSTLTYERIRASLESTFMLRLAALAIVFLLAAIITWALRPTPPVEPVAPDVRPSKLSEEQCVLDAISAALRDEAMPVPHQRFAVQLDHSEWARFGFLLEAKDRALYVGGVDGGLLARWNKEHPARRVREGDFVVKVNEIFGNRREMLREFNKPAMVNLTLLRAACGQKGEDDSETSTPEPSTSPPPIEDEGSWECYTWTSEEKEMLHSWSADEKQVCATDRRDGYEYLYTHRDFELAPGCGRCSCCRRHEQGSPQKHLEKVDLLFRPGLQGYSGFRAKEVRADGAAPATDVLSVVGGQGGGRSQVLLRYDGIIGEGADQIHPGSRIMSATLNLNVVSPGKGVEVHRMLRQWGPATSLMELGGDGITLGTDADEAVLSSVDAAQMGLLPLDVTPAVQAWAEGSPNYGMVLMPHSQDGISFMSYPSATPPALTVEVMQEPGGKAPPIVVPTAAPSTSSEPRIAASTSTMTTPTTTSGQPLLDPHGLRSEFFFSFDQEARSFEAATSGRQPDVVQKVPDVNYQSGSARWGAAETHVPFAVRWHGMLLIESAGTYSFEVKTDNIMSLSVNGQVLFGNATGGTPSPLMLVAHSAKDLLLAGGAHPIEVTMLQRSDANLMAIDLRYQGPDTDGQMVSVPQAVLYPEAPPSAAAPSAGFAVAHIRLQRKYLSEAGAELTRGGAVAALAGAFVVLGACLAILPTLQLGIEPLRRAWRARVERRQLRRYGVLAGLVEGHGASASPA